MPSQLQLFMEKYSGRLKRIMLTLTATGLAFAAVVIVTLTMVA